MLKQTLWRRLEEVSYRYRKLRRRLALAVVWLAAAAVGAALLLTSGASAVAAIVLVAASIAVAIGVWLVAQQPAKDHRWVARRIEDRHPELNSLLVSAVELEPLYGRAGYGYLQESVLRDALARGQARKWSDVAPNWKARLAQLAQLIAFVALIAVALALFTRGEPSPAADSLASARSIANGEGGVKVDPGDAEIERGASLLVMARFARRAPAEAELLVKFAPSGDLSGSTSEETRLAMSRSLDDPLFGARVSEAHSDLEYKIAYTGGETRWYKARVFDYPALERADAHLKYPDYTSLPAALVQDTRRVTAVEGTELTLTCRLNKSVAVAWLQDEAGKKIDLAQAASDPRDYVASWTLKETGRWKLHLIDAEGRTNKAPAEFHVQVTENRPPDLKFAFPARDIDASPLEEVDIEATAIDDFGLPKVGMTYSLAASEEHETVLLENGAGRQPHTLKQMIDLESLAAAPDQLLTYYLWAEDIGADGQPRRVFSDMFFAEVRPFEEVYRQGEQPSEGEMSGGQQGQMGGQGQATGELVELQKQIIGAEWKLIRRETPAFTEAYRSDTDLLHQSQQSALDQTSAIEEQLPAPELAEDLQAVREHMQKAIDHLKTAQDPPSMEAHRQALAAEQAAYQSLLALRAKEFRVIRNSQRQQQGGGGGGGGGNRSERQLQQLELRNDQNRYETQRSAREQASDEQREIRQTQNRLRELARRQEDVNKQLQELQSALEQAQTPEEREEVERRLKRLRDEQQELLRDVDELQSRLEQSQNQEQMAPAEQQLEQTRENVRRASEALEQGRVSQALAAGARAEQELRDLRDEFRRAAANQFSDQMRQMRDEARQLDQAQQDLAQRMNEVERSRATNLRDADPRDEIERGLEEQRGKLEELFEEMKQTVEESEIPEPLLSRQLYDSLRTAQQQQLGERLDRARQLLDAGFPEEARQEEAPAREGLSNLRQGVERAAESVLGDESEALRQARDELSELERQLSDEIERADPQERQEGQDGQRSGQDGQERQDSERQGQAREEAGQDGQEGQDGERQEQAAQRGEGQPAENQQEATGNTAGDGQPSSDQQQPSGNPQQATDNQQQPAGNQQQATGNPTGARGGLRDRQPTDNQQPSTDNSNRGGAERSIDRWFGPGAGEDNAVLTGDDFLDWSDRLRDVEEMLEDPELRAEAARIRERARDTRVEFKRHSNLPNWEIVRESIASPLAALRDRVAEELRRKQNQKDSLAPIDRDPTPSQFSERVRRYYERLAVPTPPSPASREGN
jgi:hypothetical protein